MLEAEGRISRQHGRGTFATDARHASQNLVRELSRLTNPIDTMEARLAIEPQQARLAALRATNGDIDRLFEAADASRDAKDPLSYEKADAAFHRRVAAASRNPMLIAVFDAVLQTALDGTWRHGRETAHCINNQAAYAADHRKIAVAIAERNAAQAEAAMRAHLNAVQKRLIEHAFPDRGRGGIAAAKAVSNSFRNFRSRFRCHSRLIASSRVSKLSECSSTQTRPRVVRAPFPALCCARRRSRSSVQPT